MHANGGTMGSVIRLDPDSEDTHPVLRRTGRGRILSTGYLEQAPAEEYVTPEETPVFLLTNDDRGVVVEHGGERLRVKPGRGYRTIAVVTDRRIVALVGDSSDEQVDGDQKFTVDFEDVTGATMGGGKSEPRLTVERRSGHRLSVFAERDGLEDVVEFVRTAAEGWHRVTRALGRLDEALDVARDRLGDGEHEGALTAAEAAYEELQTAQSVTEEFDENWPGRTMSNRVEGAKRECGRVVVDIRLDRARERTDEGRVLWHREKYDAALDAIEQAKEDYDVVGGIDAEYVPKPKDVAEEARRVDQQLQDLREAPLRKAVQADKEATKASDPAEAADAWTVALDAYKRAIQLDEDRPTRRFAGDPEAIESRLETVVKRLIEARREAGTEARKAGDWYVGTEEFDVALDEFSTAKSQYDHALSVANKAHPEVVEHLEVELEAVEDRIDRTQARRDGEDVEVVTDVDAADLTHPDDVRNHNGDGGDPEEAPSLDLDVQIEEA